MSWNVAIIGIPEKVNAKLDEYSNTLTGQSKQEFDEAKPHLQSLIAQNVASAQGASIVLKIDANGHATFTDGVKTYGTCSVQIQNFYANLAL